MNFRLGSIPVRVRGTFLFVALLISSQFQKPQLVGIAAAVVFVSILVHELGHALVGRAFGLSPQIEMHGMGGTTSWSSGRNVGNVRSVVISVAGPSFGFLLAALAYVALHRPPPNPLLVFALEFAWTVNVYWGIFNLLPLLPLDGGNIMRSTLMGLTKGRGEKPARIVSAAVAGLLLLWAALGKDLWLGLIAAMLAWTNITAFKNADQRALDLPLAQGIEKAYAALDKQDGAAAVDTLRPVLAPAASPELYQLGLRLFAYGLLLKGEWNELLPLLEREREKIGGEELARYAKTARELGKLDAASRIEALVARAPA